MLMLNVKHLTLFKPKNWKKGGKKDQGCKKIVSSFSLILPKIWFSIECK